MEFRLLFACGNRPAVRRVSYSQRFRKSWKEGRRGVTSQAMCFCIFRVWKGYHIVSSITPRQDHTALISEKRHTGTTCSQSPFSLSLIPCTSFHDIKASAHFSWKELPSYRFPRCRQSHNMDRCDRTLRAERERANTLPLRNCIYFRTSACSW
jgi:hypothetical protein